MQNKDHFLMQKVNHRVGEAISEGVQGDLA